MRTNNSRSIFSIVNCFIMILLCVVFLYPFVFTIAESFSSPRAIIGGMVFLWPVEFTAGAYKALFKDSSMITSLIFTIRLTIFGVASSLAATTLTAYPLSKRDLYGRNVFLNLIIFTMYFSGGLIPTYMLVRNIGLTNKMGSLILPCLIDTFLLIIMMSYFRGLPVELEEASKVEGANNFQIFAKVIMPLSLPVIATLTIFYAVQYWNTFFSALMYIQSAKKYPLQVKLYNVLSSVTSYSNDQSEAYSTDSTPENLKAATVLITTIPILVVYPFLQKYFVKGVTIGAVKG